MYSTIYALSSGHGKCGVALIRVSGPKAYDSLNLMTKRIDYEPRKAYLCKLRHPKSGLVLDQALSVWFPAPASFTGEDTVEFQVHGGSAVVRAVLEALGSIKDYRPAKAGEFTKRAFQTGKLNLTEVEGLADLINSETEHQRRQAFNQMDGDLHRLYDKWSESLLNLVANVEASVDFADDVEDVDESQILFKVKNLVSMIEQHMNDANAGERLRNGVQISIVGKPNVGKSTLLNILCRRPAAIVSPIAGTTRDTIEQHLDINGFPVRVIDTAGLRDSLQADEIELEGMKRTNDIANSSDLIIFLSTAEDSRDLNSLDTLKTSVCKELGICDSNKALKIFVINKSDLLSEKIHSQFTEKLQVYDNVCLMSCTTKMGYDHFSQLLGDKVRNICTRDEGFQFSGASLTRPRHRYHLSSVLMHLKNYISEMDEDKVPLSIQAHYLSSALREFGLLTGKITLSSIHDKIFSDFCIGK